MDIGLILSALAVFACANALAWYHAPATEPSDLFEAAMWPLIVGVVAGRLTSMALEDPSSVAEIRNILAIRGGVEFWPGVMAGLVVVAVMARRRGLPTLGRVADLAPYALAGAAGYQLTCFVREGCFGPAAPVGVRPDGFDTTLFPVEVAGAVVLVAVAVWLVRGRDRRSAGFTVAAAVGALALQRSVVSIWLPVVGDGPSRPHLLSIVVAFVGLLAVLVVPYSVSSSVEDPAGGRR